MKNQKIKTSQKTSKWFKECVKEGIDYTLDAKNSIGPDKKDIEVWYDLYLGESKGKDVKKFFDDLKILNANYNPSFKQLSTIFDRVELLHGEFLKRDDDYSVAVLDDYSINLKKKQKLKEAKELLNEYITGNMEEGSEEEELKKLTAENFKSEEEKATHRLIDIVKAQNNFDTIKHEGFREGLVTAGAVFKVYNLRGNTKIRKCDISRLYAARTGESYKISDAEMIAEVDYLSPSKVIEQFSESLTEKQIKNISEGNIYDDDSNDNDIVKSKSKMQREAKKDLMWEDEKDMRMLLGSGTSDTDTLVDDDDNIRVTYFSWKGYRMLYKRKRYVEGKPYLDYVGEHYEAEEDEGEVLTKMWVPEWHSGVLIGGDIVVDAKINEVQYRSKIDPTICQSGYAGGYFNIGRRKAKSLIGMAIPIMYEQDIIFAKIEDMIAKNIGKVIELDLSTKPKDWSVKKWLYYLKVHGINIKNRANELGKGMAQGKLAGMYDQGTRAVDMENSDAIGAYINLYIQLDQMLAKVTGVTDQRLGGFDYKDPVGAIENSKVQSSYITEYWFKRYEEFMLELNGLILNSAKATIDDNKIIQGIMSDASYSMLELNSKDFVYSDVGIFPVNTNEYQEFKSILKETAVNAIPNGGMSIEDLGSIFLNKNVRDMQDKLDASMKRKKKEVQQAQQQQAKAEQEKDRADKEHELAIMEKEYQLKEQLEIIKGEIELNKLKLQLQDNIDSDVFSQDSNNERDQDGVNNDLENKAKRQDMEIKERKQALEERKLLLDK